MTSKRNDRQWQHLDAAEAAKLIRRDLSVRYPLQKFHVRTSKYSGGASIRIAWYDGPPAGPVETIARQYTGATFDGMQDLKEYHGIWLDEKKRPTEPGAAGATEYQSHADFVFTDRSVTYEAGAPLLSAWLEAVRPPGYKDIKITARPNWRDESLPALLETDGPSIDELRFPRSFIAGLDFTEADPRPVDVDGLPGRPEQDPRYAEPWPDPAPADDAPADDAPADDAPAPVLRPKTAALVAERRSAGALPHDDPGPAEMERRRWLIAEALDPIQREKNRRRQEAGAAWEAGRPAPLEDMDPIEYIQRSRKIAALAQLEAAASMLIAMAELIETQHDDLISPTAGAVDFDAAARNAQVIADAYELLGCLT